ncbi:sam-dependent methyltransferase : Ribosomal RNA adenine methylase transferase OS=Isosphaera pallida (strain ATCC 43644 / DSM 9630 / IS1B) GN=Isop_2139 PE=4 SV=1: RrnaAD [Gemmata massiliana]|uniref:Ribosomal RNA adenine methylase transferase N-terminal domain-containing protein n=1 Tax=Gemmata massiliana TaxID=1210884 RepID=A0A6P2CVQ4_9BACT|nr:rRNA adenine N-6-methyltransferase family protein [Gemmata massiliana]VTR93029.1 sam-dependent methyltransferase : Ribosomal RNA adenine methylase transferase OS=Isosphaera pallida (strain ATCC 43644 / DSM 9630 / IS1B) GN=Isop_2139 PE=4 SV=1: RrnaAD [Gemmata massiliana]
MPSTVPPQPVAHTPPATPPNTVPHPQPGPNAADSAKTNPNPPAALATHTPKGPDWWLMMRAFLTQGKKIASFAPSSRFMARKILDGINWATAGSIVELGAGTGPITAEMVKLASPKTRLVVIELDPVLCGRLRERFRGSPNVEVILGDATKFGELLAERGIPKVDHVLSGLPLPSFPAEARDSILATAARTLGAGGTFRQLTVMPLVYYKLYRRYFEAVRFRFVPFNLPPGGVYVCRGFRSAVNP